ncbi:interferon regulatory factor 1 [Limosa lapponica baueri]|uniref:Interferon regulatory factor 1 n=1 Tax=Limosa lapponica baueri TaxID=1758121 RepID=A0A2I0TCI0_LIMLA|nr:interferon regulatory factor 1 [Limosa lapponica baueri]
MEITMADSTNDLYQLQLLEPTQDWHTTSVEGKGFLTNEPGTQTMGTYSYKEQDGEIDTTSGDLELRFFDQKSVLDFSWLETVRPTMQAIPCGL